MIHVFYRGVDVYNDFDKFDKISEYSDQLIEGFIRFDFTREGKKEFMFVNKNEISKIVYREKTVKKQI